MKNTSSLARYMMMYPGRESESRTPDRKSRTHPMRTDYMEEAYHPIITNKYEDEWEMEDYAGEPYNDSEHRVIGFSAASKKNASSPMNMEMANEWMGKIRNEDGTRGAHWSLDEVKRLMQQKGVEYDPVKLWVAMNAEYSDRQKVNKKYGVDRPDFYLDSAIAYWLKDADAVKDKLSSYYTYVVKH